MSSMQPARVAAPSSIDVAATTVQSAWRRRIPAITVVLVATLLMLASRLLVVSTWGSSLPFLDQWDAEALRLFKPLLEGDLGGSGLWAAHNEHRIVLPRLWAILLFAINQWQWDPLVQAYANSLALVLAVGLLLLAFWKRADDLGLRLLVTATACAMVSLLAGWDNTIVGFQSCFYFYVLFSVLSIDRATRSRAGVRAAVALGLLCAAACLSLAAGLTTTLVVIAVLGLRVRDGSLVRREALMLVIGPACVLLAGIATLPLVGSHGTLAAQTPLEFMVALAVLLQWPYPSVIGVLQWLPFGVVLLAVLRGRRGTSPDRLFIGLGLLVLSTSMVLAYTRGHHATAVASRYTDILAVGLVANLALTYRLLRPAFRHPALLSTGLALLMLAALTVESLFRLPALVERGDRMASASATVAAYLRGDIGTLRGDPSLRALHADGDLVHLEQMLADPTIRRVLPDSLLPADGVSAGPLSAAAQRIRAGLRRD